MENKAFLSSMMEYLLEASLADVESVFLVVEAVYAARYRNDNPIQAKPKRHRRTKAEMAAARAEFAARAAAAGV